MKPSGSAPLADLIHDAIGGLWGSPASSDDADEVDVSVVRGADFRNWDSRRAADAAHRRIPARFLERRRLEPGDLVLEVSGGSPAQLVGRVLIIDERAVSESDRPLICSNFCRKLRLKGGVDPNFVKRQLDWLYRSGQPDQFQTSSTNIRNLQVDDFLAGTTILLPDADRQEEITALLTRIDQAATSGASHVEAAREALARFRRAVLDEAIAGQLSGGFESERAPLGEFIDSLDQGWSPQCENRVADPGEWGVIKTTAVQKLTFVASENKALPASLEPRPMLEVHQGDFLSPEQGRDPG